VGVYPAGLLEVALVAVREHVLVRAVGRVEVGGEPVGGAPARDRSAVGETAGMPPASADLLERSRRRARLSAAGRERRPPARRDSRRVEGTGPIGATHR